MAEGPRSRSYSMTGHLGGPVSTQDHDSGGPRRGRRPSLSGLESGTSNDVTEGGTGRDRRASMSGHDLKLSGIQSTVGGGGGEDGYHIQRKHLLQHRNSFPSNMDEMLSPRDAMKYQLERLKEKVAATALEHEEEDEEDSGVHTLNHVQAAELGESEIRDTPAPPQQRDIISALHSGESQATYAVAKVWYCAWEEYVDMARRGGATEEESQKPAPGPIEMDLSNDTNNVYVNEETWKRFVRWFGVSEGHQLDRKLAYFKDEKMFDICLLSPFSGIVEHGTKKFNRFEEIGYIECQLRRVFHVADHRRSRLWISEKATVPRFRQLLLRARMLNDCLHKEKQYILALEACSWESCGGSWPTGEPGEPKPADLSKFNDLIGSAESASFSARLRGDVTAGVGADLQKLKHEFCTAMSEQLTRFVESFMRDAERLVGDRVGGVEQHRQELDRLLKGMRGRDEELEQRETDVNVRETRVRIQAV